MSVHQGAVLQCLKDLSPDGPLLADILEHQFDYNFVAHPLDPTDCMAVVSGTGMGMVHSGAVSNLAFWHITEMRTLTRTFLGRCGIICYTRLFDDILVACRGEDE